MDSVPTWILLDVQFRWIYLTPHVVPSDAEEGRLSYVHKLHIALAAQSPSVPICGKYQAGDYHPWPLLKTRAIAQDDACIDCARALQKAAPSALGQANHLLYVQGTVIGVPVEPPAPPIPAEMVEQFGEVAALVLRLQGSLGMVHDWLAHSGVHPPEALQQFAGSLPLLTPPGGLEKLSTYERFRDWCADHPQGLVIVPRPPKLVVHKVSCRYITNQQRRTFADAFGTDSIQAILTEFEREPDWCGECLQGHAPLS